MLLADWHGGHVIVSWPLTAGRCAYWRARLNGPASNSNRRHEALKGKAVLQRYWHTVFGFVVHLAKCNTCRLHKRMT